MSHMPPSGVTVPKPTLKSIGSQPVSFKQSQQKHVTFDRSVTCEMPSVDFHLLPWKKRMIMQWMANEGRKEVEIPLEQRRAKRPRVAIESEPSVIEHVPIETQQDTVVFSKRQSASEQLELPPSDSTIRSSIVKPPLQTPPIPRIKSGRPELLMAIRKREFDKAKLLLTLETTGHELVNAVDELGRTPLMWAAMHGQFDLGNALLDKGALVNFSDNAGVTPLMYAITGGSPRLFDALLKKKANVHARDLKNKTTLMWAAAHDRSHMISILLKAKVDPSLTDYKGYTVVDYGVNSGSVETVKNLLKQVYPGNPLNKTVQTMTERNAAQKKQPIHQVSTKHQLHAL